MSWKTGHTLRQRGALLLACALCVGGIVAAQNETPPQGGAAPPAEKQAGATRLLWKYAPKDSQFSGVTARGGAVFALDRRGSIHAIDATSGARRWVSADKLPLGFGFGMALSPQPEKFDALLVGCDSGLVALDPKTGKTLWHTAIPKGVDGPACAAGVVVAGGADGRVHACSLTTGKILWRHDYLEDAPPDPPGFAGANARFGGRAARPGPAAADGTRVFVPVFDQCRVLALDAATGKRHWILQTKGWVYPRPGVGPRWVVVGSQDRHYYAVDKLTGKLAWKVKTLARNEAPAAVTDRFTYFGSCDARLYAVDQGRVSWRFAIDHEKGRGAPIYSCPLVCDEVVYLAALSGKVYAVQRRDGKLLWSVCPLKDSEPNSDLVTDGVRMFVTTRKNGDAGESAVLAIRMK